MLNRKRLTDRLAESEKRLKELPNEYMQQKRDIEKHRLKSIKYENDVYLGKKEKSEFAIYAGGCETLQESLNATNLYYDELFEIIQHSYKTGLNMHNEKIKVLRAQLKNL